jgi:hypothetical protein
MGYIDPGLFGLLSQIGVVFFLVVVTGFTFFSKTIKRIFTKVFKIGKDEVKPED